MFHLPPTVLFYSLSPNPFFPTDSHSIFFQSDALLHLLMVVRMSVGLLTGARVTFQ